MSLRSASILLVLAAVSGCTEDDGSVDPECPHVERCSIGDEACQRAILAVTACVRGDKTPSLPPIRSLTRAELQLELSQIAAPPDDADVTSEADPHPTEMSDTDTIQRGLAALQLVSSRGSLDDATVAEQSGTLAAFYRIEQKDVTIISDSSTNTFDAMFTLAHEYTHYLQDIAGQVEITQQENVSYDASVALLALVEGEALVTGYRVLAAMQGIASKDINWSNAWTGIESGVVDATNASGSPLVAAANELPYLIASPAIELAWENDRSEVDALFEDPRLTGLDWLLSLGERKPSLAEKLDCYPALPPDGYTLVGADSLGVPGLFALLGAQKMASLGEAIHWRQDMLAFYQQRDADGGAETNVLAMWRIRLDSDDSAENFVRAIEPLGFSVTQKGRELAIRVSDGADDAFEALDVAACPSRAELAAIAPERDMMSNLRRPASSE